MKKSLLFVVMLAAYGIALFAQPSADKPFDVPMTNLEVTVDGFPDEDLWSKLDVHENEFWAAGAFENPPDPSDLAVTWQLAWNDVGLLLFVKVTDDVWNPYPGEGNTYAYDNVELFLYFGDDFGPDAEVTAVDGDEFFNQIRMQLNIDDETISDGRIMGAWGAMTLGTAPDGLEFAINNALVGEWHLEAIVPWEQLAQKNEVAEGMTFGYELAIGDADEAERDAISVFMNDTGSDLAWNNKAYLCTATLTGVSASVNDLSRNAQLSVYPTLATDVLNLKGNVTSVEIYNTVGQRVLSAENLSSNQLDISSLQRGVYMVTLNNEYTQKIVVR